MSTYVCDHKFRYQLQCRATFLLVFAERYMIFRKLTNAKYIVVTVRTILSRQSKSDSAVNETQSFYLQNHSVESLLRREYEIWKVQPACVWAYKYRLICCVTFQISLTDGYDLQKTYKINILECGDLQTNVRVTPSQTLHCLQSIKQNF